MRFKSATSNRMLTVVYRRRDSARTAPFARDNPAPDFNASAFRSEVSDFTALSYR